MACSGLWYVYPGWERLRATAKGYWGGCYCASRCTASRCLSGENGWEGARTAAIRGARPWKGQMIIMVWDTAAARTAAPLGRKELGLLGAVCRGELEGGGEWTQG